MRYYLGHGGYVFARVRWFVCLFVCPRKVLKRFLLNMYDYGLLLRKEFVIFGGRLY